MTEKVDLEKEPSLAERAEALEQFMADHGRFPGVAEEFRLGRLAEIEADYPDEGRASRAVLCPGHISRIFIGW